MFQRQVSGSCICVFCNQLISVDNPTCPHCGSKNPSLWGYSRSLRRLGTDLGFTAIVTWGCLTLYAATLFIDPSNISYNADNFFRFLSPSPFSTLLFGSSGAVPIFVMGRWWTVLSAGWLHGSLIHIAFNLLWIRQLTPEVAAYFGSGRQVIIYTFSAIAASLLSSSLGHFFEGVRYLEGSQYSVGASGAVFGLLGALVAYGQIMGHYSVKQMALIYAAAGLVFGIISPQVDNWGHVGGFIGGYLLSWLPGLNPRHRESIYHVFIAIACLGMIALSLVASILHGFWMLSVR